ncbi:hypothetical protein XJ32_07425 [Helicobacter bilis]|uniref:Phage-Barnase-EndoU-ColicinE5/D-RelE-like nuclease domain-containing protein n=2 Tax=Helicobacter bilis TaxID=37372 RepID=A0A1Q2LJ40_9HELI|nr:hypothetical protein [Helicobacter bilis]AQQ59942.1 hypothetical protein XJ32_07425 [Helicobacter bilis]
MRDHLNGNLWRETPYKNGKFEGILKAYCENRESLNIKPIKEFGTNYAEHYHSGETAIQKLISEAQAHKESGAKGEYKGQVAGAFHRKELGDIDLVWGDSNFGLAHILQERTKQWGEEKALRFISHLSENIQKGHIVEVEKGRIGIKTELTTIILDKKEGNNFVITAFRDSGNKKELESLNLIQSKALTSENAGTNAKESPVTSLNQESIIPQTPQEIIKQAKQSGKSVKETKELIKDSITMQSNSHLGSGLISGSAAEIEIDENGNIMGFNPAKLAAGFLGGAVGSKQLLKALNI